MAKKKAQIELYSYGEYSNWDRGSKSLPKVVNISEIVEVTLGTEFGYVLRMKQAKGMLINFRIIHPPCNDEHGNPIGDLTGELYVNSNDYEFFLGDCVWAPLHDKLGKWRLITELDGKVVADKTLTLVERMN
ncbi:MAG: DUF3859 domain-containing protein [Mangrovibacterium sp.]